MSIIAIVDKEHKDVMNKINYINCHFTDNTLLAKKLLLKKRNIKYIFIDSSTDAKVIRVTREFKFINPDVKIIYIADKENSFDIKGIVKGGADMLIYQENLKNYITNKVLFYD